MRDQDREAEFDARLETALPELPPEDVVREVTPWRRAMNRVLAGLALSAITLSFLKLDYILPLAGMCLCLLGFRTLRRENAWLRAGWIVTLLRSAYLFACLILNATVFRSEANASPLMATLGVMNLALVFVFVFCLWRGLRAVQRKAGLAPHAGGALAMLAWYAVLCLLALVQYSGLLLFLPMVAAYVLILRSLLRLSRELDEAGYAVAAAPVRVSDERLVAALLLLLAAGLACGYLFGRSYPMDWQPADASEHAGVAETKAELLALGFPAYVLDDLSAADVAACEGALQVLSDVEDYAMSEGRQMMARTAGGNDPAALRVTGVAVRLPGERERWRIFQHFLWLEDPGFYSTESIQLWPAYRMDLGWAPDGEVSGRLLYDRDGLTYVSPYHRLGSETYSSGSVLFGETTSTDVFAAFSLPREGAARRGYLAYTVQELRDGCILDAWFNYTHQTAWLQYPVLTATEAQTQSGRSSHGAFVTAQDALQLTWADGELVPLR